MKAIKTVNQVVINSVTQETGYVGFLPTKILRPDETYKGALVVYQLVEQFDTDGVTSLGFSLGNQIAVNEDNLAKCFNRTEMQGIYDSLVAQGKIDPTAQDYLTQENILLYQGAILQIVSYKLFGITSETDLEIITIFEPNL